jgi:crossover junction endodeoxyribonuclease RuvC
LAVIIGIDPGSLLAGYGILSCENGEIKGLECGVIEVRKEKSFPLRLAQLGRDLRLLFAQYKPDAVAVEQVFLGKNVDSAFKLGHARGVCFQVAGEFGAPVYEYAARSVKKSVTGSGAADKEQVKLVVENLVRLRSDFFDATDALAIALAHVRAMEQKLFLADQGVEL